MLRKLKQKIMYAQTQHAASLLLRLYLHLDDGKNPGQVRGG